MIYDRGHRHVACAAFKQNLWKNIETSDIKFLRNPYDNFPTAWFQAASHEIQLDIDETAASLKETIKTGSKVLQKMTADGNQELLHPDIRERFLENDSTIIAPLAI